MKFLYTTLFFLLSVIGFSQLPGYNFYKSITIQNSEVVGSGYHTNFPVLIQHTDSDLRHVSYSGNVQNINGFDIRFTSDDGLTLLEHEMEKYDPATGSLTFWVNIPLLSTSTNTIIRIYYGNNSAVTNTSSATTWDLNYQGVWHMSETGIGSRFDAADVNHATPINFDNNEGTVGIAGDANSLERSTTDYLTLGSPTSLNITGDITVSAWVNVAGYAGTQRPIIGKGDYQYLLRAWSNNRFTFFTYDGAWHECMSDATLILGEWYYVVGRVSSGQVRLFVNGVEQLDIETGGIITSPVDVEIGRNTNYPTRLFDGIIDEVRISNIARSNDWISTEFNNIKSPSAFYTLSTQKAPAPSWCWAVDALAGGNEEFLDLATDPATGISYAVGYFNGDISTDFPMGLNGTPDMSSSIGNQDGLVAKYDASGNVIWAFKIGAVGETVVINGVSTNSSQDVFVTGSFTGTVNVQGTQTSIALSPIVSGGAEDMFVAAYDASGNLQWVSTGSGLNGNTGFDIAVNNSKVFVGGRYRDDITITGLASPTLSLVIDMEAFVAAFDITNGNGLWARRITSSTWTKCFGVAADNSEVFATGTFQGTNVNFEPPGGPINIANYGVNKTDVWVAGYDEATGSVIWGQTIGSSDNDEGRAIAIDPAGVYVTGGVNDNGALVQFPGGVTASTGNSKMEIFTCRLFRGTGLTDWVHIEQSVDNNDAKGMGIVNDGFGNLYITGFMAGTTNFNMGLDPIISGGGLDAFVMARKDVGSYLWTQTASDNNDIIGNGLGYDNLGGVYVAGMMKNQATFGVLPVLNDAAGDDAFIAKINCTSPCNLSIICPSDITVTANASCQYNLLDYVPLATPIASCGIASVVQSPASGTLVNAGITPIKIILTDLNGNKDSCSFNLIVEANVNPTIINCGDVLLGESTFGQGNNGNLFACSGVPTPGEDIYYQITVPAGNFLLTIKINNASDANDTDINTFWVGGSCPLGSGCISADNYNLIDQDFDSNGQNALTFNAIGPGTYYFVVDSETDGIDSYDITFNCLVSGIEFDEGGCHVNDANLDGVVSTVNGLTNLNVAPCQAVTICNDLYIRNVNDFEWMDSVKMALGPCFTNVTGFTPDNPPLNNGFYNINGEWDAVYSLPTNSIVWEFDHSSINPWGDGNSGNYFCNKYTFCFNATISAACNSNSDLNIDIGVGDDGVPSGTGNTSAGFDAVTIDDFIINNSPPTIACPGNLSVNNDAGLCSAVVNGIGPTASGDECPTPTITYALTGATTGSGNNNASGSIFNVGVTTVTYTIADVQGATANCSFTVTVNDVTNPTISCPANVSIPCPAVVNGIAPTASGDNCGTASISYTLTGATTGSGANNASGTFFNAGVTTVTYTITDLSGNTGTCNFTVTVSDVTNPTISCPSNVNISCPAVVNGIAPTASGDNCGVASISYTLTGATTGSGANNASGTFFNAGVTTVTYTVTDLSGNTGTCSFTVTVSDVINPTISCPANISIPCPAAVNGIAPTASGDNCGVASISYSLSGATTGSGANDASGTFFNAGVTTVTYTVTDLSSNTSTCSFTVTVSDVINPTISCPSNVSIPCPAAVNGIAPTASGDNCGVASISYSLSGVTTGSGANDASGTFFNAGVTTVTYTVTDLSGNTGTCSFTVTVSDVINPTITCPAPQAGNVNASCQFSLLDYSSLATTGDNCGVASVTQSPASGTLVGVGTTVVTLTAMDASGNSASCSFNVNISDVTAPTITCPLTQSANVNASCQFSLLDYTSLAIVNDNCGVASVTQSPAIGTNVGVGTTAVTLTVIDVNGNTASCNFNVIITDNILPTITCPAPQVGNVNASCQFSLLDYTSLATTGDNCGVASVTQSPAIGTNVGVGTTTVTLTVLDVNGNTASCNFNLIVTDNILPTITCPLTQSGNVNASCQFSLLDYTSLATTGDNCGVASVTQSPAIGTNVGVGTTTVTLTVLDVNGNTASCNFNLIVTDNILPTITCPLTQSGNVNASCQFSLLDYTSLAITGDNCGVASVTQSPAIGTNVGVGTTAVTLTVLDVNGNTASCNFNVIITDNILPTITCPLTQSGNVNASCQFSLLDYTSLAITGDNCGVASVTQSPAIGTNVGIGTTAVTLTVTDVNGNTASCNFNVIITDNILPTISCPANQTVVGNASCQGILGDCTSLVVTNDNCGVSSITQSPIVGTLFSGLQSVTIIVADVNGNLDSCSFDVTVVDISAPIFSCPTNVTQNNDVGFCTAIVNNIDPITLTDNCSVPILTYNLSGSTTANGNGVASGETFNLGVTTVTYTATDAAGNSTNCSFDVTIIDNEKPVISCSADIFSCDTLVSWSAPTATDNCGVSSIIQISGLTSGSDFPVGTTTIKYVATDISNNTDTCSFDVAVYPPSDATWSVPNSVCENGTLVDLSLSITGNTGGFFIGPGVTSPNFDPSVGAGNYSLSYIQGVSGCEDTVINSIMVVPSPAAFAGFDSDICELDYVLNGTSTNGIGTWSGTGLTFAPNVNDPSATVTSSSYGAQMIYWTVDQMGICSAMDSVEITFYETPTADAGVDQNLNFLFSTYHTGVNPSSGTGVWSGMNGSVFDNNDPLSFVDQLALGENIFYWTVSNGPCPSATDEIIIFVNDIFIPQAITPNFDNKNDYFVINGITFTDYNKLEIFNRWGQLVYSTENYQNDWYGKSNDGNELPADTYFYILNVNRTLDYNGYIVIRR